MKKVNLRKVSIVIVFVMLLILPTSTVFAAQSNYNINLASVDPWELLSNAGTISQAEGGHSHTIVLMSDGTVWAWGSNEYGQLGNGTYNSSIVPVKVVGLENVTSIEAGEDHNLALINGSVWEWGGGKSTPTKVSGLPRIEEIAAGGFHSLAVNSGGIIFSWGSNEYGQLGYRSYGDEEEFVPTPQIISSFNGNPIKYISAGSYHSLAVDYYGDVYQWGADYTNGWEKVTYPSKVNGLSNVNYISACGARNYARVGTSYWAWGINSSGQLGDGTTTDRRDPVLLKGMDDVKSIKGGWGHTIALRGYGSVWTWGANGVGQLGDGTTTSRSTPKQVSNLTANFIAAGDSFSLALDFDRSLWTWGWNSSGQLGDGTYINSKRPKFIY